MSKEAAAVLTEFFRAQTCEGQHDIRYSAEAHQSHSRESDMVSEVLKRGGRERQEPRNLLSLFC